METNIRLINNGFVVFLTHRDVARNVSTIAFCLLPFAYFPFRMGSHVNPTPNFLKIL